MADFATHALLGAACFPEHPLLGAAFGLAADLPLVPINAYTLIQHRKLAIGSNWKLAPAWMETFYIITHGLFIPAAFMFYFWFFIPALFPLALAYVSHVIIDIPLHDSSSAMWPLWKRWISDLGKNWWTDWKIPAATISISGLIVAIQQGLI